MNTVTNTSTTTTTRSSSTRAYTRAREEVNAEFRIATEEYQDTIGRPMPKSIQEFVWQQLSTHAWDIVDLSYALAETAAAPNPSWRYTLAIMRRLSTSMPWERESHGANRGRE